MHKLIGLFKNEDGEGGYKVSITIQNETDISWNLDDAKLVKAGWLAQAPAILAPTSIQKVKSVGFNRLYGQKGWIIFKAHDNLRRDCVIQISWKTTILGTRLHVHMPSYYGVQQVDRDRGLNHFSIHFKILQVPFREFPLETRLTFLEEISYFNRKELEAMWNNFIIRSGNQPVITREKYLEQRKTEIADWETNKLVNSFFDVISGFSVKDNVIDFEEWVQVCGKAARGSAEEKLELAFDICDFNRDGYISREEATCVLDTSLTLAKHYNYQTTSGRVEDVVENLFTTCGNECVKNVINLPGVGAEEFVENKKLQEGIDKKNFIAAGLLEPDIAECFGLFRFIGSRINETVEKPIELAVGAEMQGVLTRIGKKKMFFILRDGFLAYYDKHQKSITQGDIVPLGVRDLTQAVINEQSNIFEIRLSQWFTKLKARGAELVTKWVTSLRGNTRLGFRFQSFTPMRKSNSAKWFINGQQYFTSLMPMLLRAKKRIMIAGWYLAPGLYLMRDPVLPDSQLERILLKKAEEGVKVYVLIWGAPKFPFELKSAWVCEHLMKLHPNIRAMNHTSELPKSWSHHQKSVIIDDEIAFIGGIDLAYNRYDDESYSITDVEGRKYPGRDYGHQSYHDESNGDPDEDVMDRTKMPRMPWHDIECQIVGPAVNDVAINFIQKWNYVAKSQVKLIGSKHYIMTAKYPKPIHSLTESELGYPNCNIQILRSACTWSFGIPVVEKSIYKGYEYAIRNSQHYVYIENQYFISSLDPLSTPQNRLLAAIYYRIKKAIANNENFKLIVVIPVHPSGKPAAQPTRYVMKYTAETISCGKSSLLGKLREEFTEEQIKNYVNFYSLRNHGWLNDIPFISMVYIHAKLMIVDDKIVIIGSANINDRSLMGDRDSEIAAYIEHQDMIPGSMGGKEVPVSAFARDLRMRLWRVFLGLPHDDRRVEDPILSEPLWRETSGANSKIYRTVYPLIPETITSKEELDAVLMQQPSHTELLEQTKGFVIEHPSNFMSGSLEIPAIMPTAAKIIFV